MSLIYNIQRVQRMHQMILHKRTGSPAEFARKLGVARSTVYVLINELKELGAPIIYCKHRQSFRYLYTVEFHAGFTSNELSHRELRQVSAGFMPIVKDFNTIPDYVDYGPIYLFQKSKQKLIL